jgi:hypothetical protein
VVPGNGSRPQQNAQNPEQANQDQALSKTSAPQRDSNDVPKSIVSVKSADQSNDSRPLVEQIAADLKPSGNSIIGGNQTLVFGQKKVVAGDTLNIMFNGVQYEVTVIDINKTDFTIELNGTRYTRPIGSQLPDHG